MRLIDADELKKNIPDAEPDIFENCRTCGTLTRYDAENLIDDAPTVDAVPVVRCKDCKYVKHWKNRAGMSGVGCYLLAVDTHPDSFCSFGERKDDAHEPMGA